VAVQVDNYPLGVLPLVQQVLQQQPQHQLFHTQVPLVRLLTLLGMQAVVELTPQAQEILLVPPHLLVFQLVVVALLKLQVQQAM
jgi:hypothetical protein